MSAPLDKEKMVKLLEEIGLSQNEACVYFALLASGPSTVLKIGKASGVKRTTVYPVLKSLEEQGLVRIESAGLKQKFVAEDPNKLEEVLTTKHSTLKEAIPDIRSLYISPDSASSVKQYKGLRAVKAVYEDILKNFKPNDYCLVIGDVARWQALDENFFMNHIEARAKLGVDTKLMFSDSEKAQWRVKFAKNFNEKVKILPAGTEFDTHLMLTPNCMLILQLNEPLVGFLIDNKATMKMQKQLFEIIWNSIPDVKQD